ncbi:MAG: hypothetical protein HYY40_00215 [Bacteroidetes bacterium]|nr:hypothetical protein [Bacteroidota bacterium]
MITGSKKQRNAGIAGTVVIHLLLVIILLFVKCTSSVRQSLPEELGGFLINFGESDEGFGEVKTETEQVTKEEETQPVTEVKTETNETAEIKSENLKTQTTEEAPSVKSSEETVKEESEKKEEQPAVNPLALYKKDRNPGISANEGEKEGTGDQGNPDGSPLSDNYSKGSGTGFNWSLHGRGRKLVGNIEVHDESQETGKVVVQISVGRDGKVTQATPVLLGSTTTNQYLWKLARQAAFTAKFSPDPAATEEQKGTMVFDFKVLK